MASKRPGLTLDLDKPGNAPKRARLVPASVAAPILTTPDVQMLKLTSPELAKFLTSANGLPTPTPSGYFPKTVTEEQEIYVKGFEDALQNLRSRAAENETAITTIEKATAAHARLVPPPPLPVMELPSAVRATSRPSSGASGSLDSSSESGMINIKRETTDDDDDDDDDDDYEGSHHLMPVNLEDQERIKLERKRLRNRVAASKCRKRKLERISNLDDKVKALKGENAELASVVKKLKEAICNLKQEVMEHVTHGCQIMVADASF